MVCSVNLVKAAVLRVGLLHGRLLCVLDVLLLLLLSRRIAAVAGHVGHVCWVVWDA